MEDTLLEKPRFSLASRRSRIFFSLFGVSLFAFGAGFSDCLFDIDKAEACVAHAESWIEPFRAVGDHLIAWAQAIFIAAFNS